MCQIFDIVLCIFNIFTNYLIEFSEKLITSTTKKNQRDET